MNTTVDDFLLDCKKRILANSSKFEVLLNGQINKYFSSVHELVDTLITIDTDTILSAKYNDVPWNNLFMSIGYYYFGVNTVQFLDNNKENINLLLPRGLSSADNMFPLSHKNLVIIQFRKQYYPIYLLNTELFKKTGIITNRLYSRETGIISTISSIVSWYFDNQHETVKEHIDLNIIRDMAKTQNIKILGYFINYSNLCYAVYIKYKQAVFYFPIHASHYSLDDNVELIFDSYSTKYESSFENIWGFCSLYNKYIDSISKTNKNIIYPKITVEKWLKYKNKIIGFMCDNVSYYTKHMKNIVKKHCDVVQLLLYDPLEVNKIIADLKNKKAKISIHKKLNSKIQVNMYDFYTYKLIVLTLTNMFNKKRNTKLRNQLVKIIAKTNLNKNTNALLNFINDKIPDEEDQDKLKALLNKFYSETHDKKDLLNYIKKSYFEFDKIAFKELRVKSHGEVARQLKKILNPHIKIVSKVTQIDFPNILTVCDGNNNTDYCHKGKMIIEKKKLDDIIEMLAYDVINPAKWKWLFDSSFVEKSVEYFRFIRRDGEFITMEFV